MAATPKNAWGWVKALLHSVYDQPDADAVHAQFDRILDALADKLPAVAAAPRRGPGRHLGVHRVPEGGLAADLVQQSPRTAEPGDPPPHRCRRHLPRPDALIRLVGAVLAEQHDEWTEQRRYLGLDILAKAGSRNLAERRTRSRGGDHHRHHRIEFRTKITRRPDQTPHPQT